MAVSFKGLFLIKAFSMPRNAQIKFMGLSLMRRSFI